MDRRMIDPGWIVGWGNGPRYQDWLSRALPTRRGGVSSVQELHISSSGDAVGWGTIPEGWGNQPRRHAPSPSGKSDRQ